MHTRWWLVILMLRTGVGGLEAADPAARRAEERSRIELRPIQSIDLAKFDAERPDIRSIRPERRPVSDLLVELSSEGQDIRAALALAEVGTSVGFRARILAVIGGRIYKDGRATCGPFSGGTSICRADCEGGQFALSRISGDAGVTITLAVGALGGEADPTISSGFAITPCGLEGPDELRLVPKRGLSLAEIRFTAGGEAD